MRLPDNQPLHRERTALHGQTPLKRGVAIVARVSFVVSTLDGNGNVSAQDKVFAKAGPPRHDDVA